MSLHIQASQDIVNQCIAGDRRAQYRLYKNYCDAMYSVCYRMMQNKEEAKDALQEAFIQVFKKLGTYRGEATIGAWIKQIVCHTCINHIRKRPDYPLTSEDYVMDGLHETETGYSWDENDYTTIQKIKEAMSELSDGYRTVINLYLFEGYDHEEIAEILDISPNTSKTQYMRGKKKLKELLKQKIHE